MYQVICGDYILFDIRDEQLRIYDAKLTLEVNTAGSFTFTIYQSHPYYGLLRKLASIITILKDKRIIFKGRVMEDKQVFNNSKTIRCEGKAACFNDSVFRPFDFSGPPKELFKMLIDNHNNQVADFQQFKAGKVSVIDANDYIVRSSIDYLSTWEVLKTRLFDSGLEGYIWVRYEDDGDYLDYLADFDHVSGQAIRFGENLLDFAREISAEETYTAIIPRGAEIDGSRIGIESVNDGKDYIVNTERAELYGIIYVPASESVWDSVTLPANLLQKARDYLDNTKIKLKETISLSAVDLHLTDKQLEGFMIGQYIDVISKPHNLHERYLLRKIELNLNDIQSTRITLGESKLTLTDFQTISYQKAADAVNRVTVIEKDYVTAENVNSVVEEVTGEKINEVMDGYISNNLVAGENIDILVREDKKLEISADVSAPVAVSELVNDMEYQTKEDVSTAISQATIQGKDGKSAYEVAVDNGFLGTEIQWLASLQGQDGADGLPGAAGRDGVDGLPGEAGRDGVDGLPGEAGKDGVDGLPGEAATIAIGSVTTGAAGSAAQVTNSGTATNAVFNFVIPKGDKGETGDSSGSGGESIMYGFEIREDGHLWLVSESENINNFYINDNGYLIYRTGGE